MLPMIRPTLRTGLVAAITALSLTLPAVPAQAWGQREQDTLKGAVGALVLKAIIDDAREDRRRAPVYREEPRPHQGHGYHHTPRQHEGSIYQTPAARAFNSYSRSERKLIQRRLAQYGYYRGGVDGSFGPGTYSAVVAYARAQGMGRDLGSNAGAFGVYDGLIF